MPRPVNPDSARLELRSTTRQKAAWMAAAEADGRTLSSWIARTLDQAAKKLGVSNGFEKSTGRRKKTGRGA
jgi:uncharacterized protein (DUF1778 family)